MERSADEPRDEELRPLLEAAGDGLAVVRAGIVSWANASLARLAGFVHSRDLVGRPASSLFAEEPSRRTPEATSGLARIARRRGAPLSVRVAFVELEAPGCHGLVIRDASAEQTLEEELLRLGRELAAANRRTVALRERLEREGAQREEMLTVVSHELRTPVTVISGYNRLLLSGEIGELNERQEHFLREAQKSCQRLNTFIGNLLEAARKASVVGPLEVTRAPLEPTVRAALGQLTPLLSERELAAEVRVDPATPAPRFDPPRIEQVLINLLGNAVKYAPPGTRVEISVRAGVFDGRPCAEVSVSDEGPGVSPRDRERIFEPYVRTGEAAEEGGLGLGLALCKRIVEAHGGAIHVEPRPTGGSRFVFFLPAPEAA